MDPVTSTTPQARPAATQSSEKQPGVDLGAGTNISSDFDTFLRMLTVQVQNQDPLNPVDATDYATQLATFSGVEQQVLTNDLLTGLQDLLGGGSLQQMGGFVGMEGLVNAPGRYDGTPIAVRPDYAPNADSAALLVRDEKGTLVQRFGLEVGEEAVLWTGLDETGTPVPAGTYTFQVESYEGSRLLNSQLVPAYSRIEEARRENGAIVLRMSDGTELPAEEVSGLRTPAA